MLYPHSNRLNALISKLYMVWSVLLRKVAILVAKCCEMFNNFNYLLKFHLPEPIWIWYLQMKSLKVYLSNIVLRNNRCEDIRYFSTKKESVQLIKNLINLIVFSL